MALGMGNLGELIVSVGTDLTNLNSGLKQANLKVQQTRGEILKSTAQIGRSMTVMGAVITGSIGLMVKQSIDFESAFAGVRKTVDASEAEFTKIAGSFRKLSTEIPITASELANIGEKAGQLGISGVDNLTKFSKTIALIGVTTDLMTESAAIDFARIANIMKEPIENVDRMGASIVDLGNNFAANEVEITAFATRIAGAGQLMKLTTADVFGLATSFAAVGVKAEMGGTAVQKVMLKMIAAVAEGNKDLAVFAKVAGLTIDQFKKMKEEDPSEVFLRFVEGLGELGDDAIPILENLGLANERVRSSFLRMSASSDIMRDALNRSSIAWDENTALQIEAEKRFATTASQLKVLLNNVVELGRMIGDTLIPALKPMIEDFKSWLKEVAEFTRTHPELIRQIVELIAKLGLLMLAIGPIMMALPGMITLFNGLKFAALGLQTAIFTLTGTIVTLQNFGAVAAAAFVGWKLGRLIGEVTGLDEALSGEDGLFTRMMIKLDALQPKLDKALNDAITLGLGILGIRVGGQSEDDPSIAGETVGGEGEVQSPIELETILIEENLSTQEDLKNQAEIADNARRRREIAASYSQEISIFNFRARLRKVQEDAERNHEKVRQMLKQQTYDQFVSLLEQAAAESKTAAMLLKMVRTGEAIANTATGVTQALAAYPPPFSFVMAGLVSALGAAQIALINGVQFATGTDSVPAMVSPGEMIIPTSFSDAIRQGRLSLGGPDSISNISRETKVDINFYGDINTPLDVEEMKADIGRSINNANKG